MLDKPIELCSYMYSTSEWSYASGITTLAYSLKEKGNLPSMVWNIIWDGDPEPGVRDDIERFGFKVVEWSVSGFDIYGPMRSEKPHLARGDVWKKLAFLLMPEGKRYAFIDVDIVCLKDAREMLYMPHLSAAPAFFPDGRLKGINTHFWVGEPSQELHDEIVAMIPEQEVWPLLDQSLMSLYAQRNPDVINPLDIRWKSCKRQELKLSKPDWEKHKEDAILFHYPGLYKPWFDGTWEVVRERPYPESHAIWHRMHADMQVELAS